MDAFLETKDVLDQQLSAYRAGTEPDAERVAHICGVLRQLALESGGVVPVAPVVVAAPVAPLEVPVSGGSQKLKVHFSGVNPKDQQLLQGELAQLGQVKAQTETDSTLTVWLDTACTEDDLLAVCCFVVEPEQIRISAEAGQGAAAPVVDAPAALAAPEPAPVPTAAVANNAAPSATAQAKESSSIRVDVDKVDQIINLVGELVITQSMLTQTATSLDPVLHARLFSGMGHLERNARDLQQSVMSIRMMPMDYVFNRFPRLIRDLSAKLGKQVQLVTEGKETELDKGLIERIIDPITHLVRNSLDHGIEGPEVRRRAGKDPQGRLTLSAQHQGGSIVIEVRDDGAGLVRDKILAKAT